MRKRDAQLLQDTPQPNDRTWTPPRLTVMDVRADTAGIQVLGSDAVNEGTPES